MKKAVIRTGGKQYVVSEGDTLNVERLKSLAPPQKSAVAAKADAKATTSKPATKAAASISKLSFEPLLVIDGERVEIGAPTLPKATVTAEVVEADIQADKVTAIRYKAKKRVRKVRGHRQRQSVIKITKIA